jgi:nucleoside-diphosphate-sugar epimerase
MKNILITGGNGYIASALKADLSNHYQITTITRNDFDLTDPIATNKWFANKYFDAVIHTAVSGGSRLLRDKVDVIDKNLQMYYNLLHNSSTNFEKLINIGSGAEIHLTDTPYGLSKYIIRKSMLPKDNFYNLRVYAVFDEFEIPTRFIKNNITNYMESSPIVITQNKYMDFFYMKDFVNLVRYYLDTTSPPKEIDCAYKTTESLKDIAEKINMLGNHTVEIECVAEGLAQQYSASHPRIPLPIDVYGLDRGVELTYEALCKR